jgi:hypothetical protein
MTFKQRLPYFLFGLFLGVIVVIFIYGKKNTTFDYGPNARVLKNIRLKEMHISAEIQDIMDDKGVDTSMVNTLLRSGKADLWNKIKKDSCISYDIRGRKALQYLTITVRNCEDAAYLEAVSVNRSVN